MRSYIESKKNNIDSLKENYEYIIDSIDSNYALWNSKRESAYKTLKALNEKIEELMKERDQYGETHTIMCAVDSVYDNIDTLLKEATEKECECCKETCEKTEEPENDEPNTEEAIQSLLSVFKDLFC